MTDEDTRYYEVRLTTDTVVRVTSLDADLVKEALETTEGKAKVSSKKKFLLVQLFKQAVRRGAFELKERA